MATRYKLDGVSFSADPLNKRWSRTAVARGGAGEGIFTDFWQVELSFGILSDDETAFFMGKWLAGGLHSLTIPHPITNVLATFTGTNIQSFDFDIMDVEQDNWRNGPRLLVDHISLRATGTP